MLTKRVCYERRHQHITSVMVTALGLAIQGRRKQLGLSQDDLAARAQLHRTYISEIERRSRNMSVKILVQLALALEMSPSQLLRSAESLAVVANEQNER